MTNCGMCNAFKVTYGTSVELCPECDFARCRNKQCNRTVKELDWAVCPYCRTRL